jgi:hypothetical protein
MKTTLNQICRCFLTLVVLLTMAGPALPQERISLETSANGSGTIKVGREEFELHTVVVKLMEDGGAEITLVSEMTFFFQGTWSKNDKLPRQVDLKITGGATGGGVQGSGSLRFLDDGKSLVGLTLEGSSKTSKRQVKVTFVAN